MSTSRFSEEHFESSTAYPYISNKNRMTVLCSKFGFWFSVAWSFSNSERRKKMSECEAFPSSVYPNAQSLALALGNTSNSIPFTLHHAGYFYSSEKLHIVPNIARWNVILKYKYVKELHLQLICLFLPTCHILQISTLFASCKCMVLSFLIWHYNTYKKE